jgi:hypothetical protein
MLYFYICNSKDDGNIISENYFIWGSISRGLSHICSYSIFYFINFLRYLWEINISMSYESVCDFSVSCPWLWWKWLNLLGFPVFELFFIVNGYYRKSFLFMVAKTSACVVVRDVVTSSKNIRQSWLCLMFFLDALVGG